MEEKTEGLLSKKALEDKLKMKFIKAAFTKMWNTGQVEVDLDDKKNKKLVLSWAYRPTVYGKIGVEGEDYDLFKETFPIDDLTEPKKEEKKEEPEGDEENGEETESE